MPHSIPGPSRSGVTLFEMLAATLLTVLLLSALTGVIRGLHQQTQAAQSRDAGDWVRRTTQRMEWDVRNARQLRIAANRLWLEGYSARDWESGAPLHLRTRVIYRVLPGQGLLVREEVRVEPGLEVGERQVELLACGVSELLVGRADDRLSELRIPVPDRDRLHPVPHGLRIILLANDNALTDFVIWRGDR
jgi:hypothetical protein